MQDGYGRRTEETAGGSSKRMGSGRNREKLRNDAQYFAIVKVLKLGRKTRKKGREPGRAYYERQEAWTPHLRTPLIWPRLYSP